MHRTVSICRGRQVIVLETTDSVARMNDLSEEHAGDWLLVSTEAPRSQFWSEAMSGDVDLAVSLPVSSACGTVLVNEIGVALASLVLCPTLEIEVLLSPQVRANRPAFRNVATPVEDLVVRTTIIKPDRVRWVTDTKVSSTWALVSGQDADLLPELAPNVPGDESEWLRDQIQNLPLRQLLQPKCSSADFLALQAGLWQVHSYLDPSHECSQQIEGEGTDRNGDYWHAIMHRREPDYDNSKYWFRRVGQHSVFQQLPAIARQALSECDDPQAAKWADRLCPSGRWDAFAFVDLCQAARNREYTSLGLAAWRIQWAEMLLLLVHSYRCVVGTRSLT